MILRLGLWGAKSLGEPRPEDVLTADSLVLALRATFQPDAAADLRAGFELHLGPVVAHTRIDHGTLETGEGPLPGADLVIETGPAFRALLAGELTPAEAVAGGAVQLAGDPDLLARFVEAFRIPPLPAPLPA